MSKIAVPGGNSKRKGKKLSTEGLRSLMRRLQLGDLKRLFAYRKIHGGWMPKEWGLEAVNRFAVEHEDCTPGELGEMLKVTGEEYRQAGPFRRLAPLDMDASMRADYSRIKSNERRRQKRRAMGMKPQTQSLSQDRPWAKLNMSQLLVGTEWTMNSVRQLWQVSI